MVERLGRPPEPGWPDRRGDEWGYVARCTFPLSDRRASGRAAVLGSFEPGTSRLDIEARDSEVQARHWPEQPRDVELE